MRACVLACPARVPACLVLACLLACLRAFVPAGLPACVRGRRLRVCVRVRSFVFVRVCACAFVCFVWVRAGVRVCACGFVVVGSSCRALAGSWLLFCAVGSWAPRPFGRGLGLAGLALALWLGVLVGGVWSGRRAHSCPSDSPKGRLWAGGVEGTFCPPPARCPAPWLSIFLDRSILFAEAEGEMPPPSTLPRLGPRWYFPRTC